MFREIVKHFTVLFLVIFLWQLYFIIFNVKSNFFFSPIEILKAFRENLFSISFLEHILASLKRVLGGFIIASFFGIGTALVLGYFKIHSYANPVVELIRPIPPIAWIPIAILIFGLGDGASYFIVFLGGFFPIFTNTLFGVIALPKIYQNVSASFELKNIKYIRMVLIPYCLPSIFNGLKVGLGMSWMSLIASELVGAQNGLGYFIQFNRLLLRTDNIIVGMVTIGLIGLFLAFLLEILKKIFIPWEKY